MKSPRVRWAGSFPALALTAAFALVAPAACEANSEVSLPGGTGGGQCLEQSEKCGFEGCDTNDDCNAGRFCNSFGACAPSCEKCGAPCGPAMPCGAGQYCSVSGTCEQECRPNVEDPRCGQSPQGEIYLCGIDGKCTQEVEPEGPDLDGVGGSDGTGGTNGEGGGMGCIDEEVRFTPEIPNVVLLIDQSFSMTGEQGFSALVEQEIAAGTYVPWECEQVGNPSNSQGPSETWRWNVVRTVLFNPTDGIVKQLDGDVRFGMALYSSENGNVPGRDGEPKVCPMLTEVPIVEEDVEFGNYDQMLAQMQCSDLIVDTPTRESLTAVAEKLAAAELEGPKIIVLATDGLPDSCDCPNYNNQGPPPATCRDVAQGGDDPEANWVERGDPPVRMPPSAAEQYDVIQEAKRIYEELGIVVHVVDVSTPDDPTLRAHLTEVATAAHGEIYDGTRPSGLIDAFRTIIDGARSCVIDLQGEILAGKEDQGTVTLDGVQLELLPDGVGDGWKLNSSSQLELVGEPCDLIKSGQHDIDIDFPCDVFIPDPIFK